MIMTSKCSTVLKHISNFFFKSHFLHFCQYNIFGNLVDILVGPIHLYHPIFLKRLDVERAKRYRNIV